MLHDPIGKVTTMAKSKISWALKALPWQLAFVSAGFGASNSWALELGQIEVLSAQGAPLYAHFELRDVARKDWDTLSIALQSDSEANEPKRITPLQGAKLRWQRPRKGLVAAAIEGFKPVESATLPITLVVRWGGGEIKRKFDLDIPEVSADAPLVIYRNDTLSELMITHRYGQGTLAQRMIATQRANPSAFIGGNIHRIKTGKMLTLPSRGDILNVDAAEAEALVKTQWAEFEAYRRGLAQRTEMVANTKGADAGVVDTPASGGAATPTGDRLSVSQGQSVEEKALAAQQALATEAQRQSELHNNLKDLKGVAQELASGGTPPSGVDAKVATEPALNEPAWVTAIKHQPWLMPLVGLVLVCMALLVWLRQRSDRANPIASGAPTNAPPDASKNHADTVGAVDAADAVDAVEVMDPPPQLQPKFSLDKLIPDVDLELPPLDEPALDGEQLLEDAKTALRNGDANRARELALLALESRDPVIQSNAKALLERL